MANNLIDELALEEIKLRLTVIENQQDDIIGHLESIEAMLGEISPTATPCERIKETDNGA